jgi:hypothetical protein
MFGPHRSRTELYGFQPGVRFNLDVQMPGTWTSMYCMKSRAKTSTYIPTDNNVQQHQLRKPEPPSLIHPVVHMTIAPLARPRSSALCALLYLFICNSYMPRGRSLLVMCKTSSILIHGPFGVITFRRFGFVVISATNEDQVLSPIHKSDHRKSKV